MNIFNSSSDVYEIASDPKRTIPKAHLKSVCKIGCGNYTCRYLASFSASAGEFKCMKNSPIAGEIDAEIRDNPKWRARGDNCDGLI